MAKFELPRDCTTGLVRSRTLSNLGLDFRNFKSRMWSQYGQKDKMPDWDKYPLLKPYWSGFKKYKQSEEATKMSQENKMNVKKKVHPSRDMDEQTMRYNPRSILDAHMAMETDLGSMH
jgi:hypothetical protein